MFIGKVTGQVVTTQKEPSMATAKLAVVEAYAAGGPGAATLAPTGRVLVAVDSLGAGRLLHSAILREQRQRRNRLACQHARQIVEQRERGPFDRVDDQRRKFLRFTHAPLHGRLRCTQHRRRGRPAARP